MADQIQAPPKRCPLAGTGKAAFVVAGMLVLVSVSAPNPGDFSAHAGILTLLGEDRARTSGTLLALPAGVWAFAAGLAAIRRSIPHGLASGWASLGTYPVLIGAAAVTVHFGLAAGALVEGTSGGTDTGVILLAASAYVRAFGMMAFWLGVSLVGVSMLFSGVYPRWSGVPAVGLGLAMVLVSGLSIATGVTSLTMSVTDLLAGLTALWGLFVSMWGRM